MLRRPLLALTHRRFCVAVATVYLKPVSAPASGLHGKTPSWVLPFGLAPNSLPANLSIAPPKESNQRTGKKVSLPGLVRRRAAEGELWLKTDSDDPFLTSTDMPQKVYADETRASFLVAARDGLRLRAGGGTGSDIVKVLPKDTEVFVLREKDDWAAVDLEGDGKIDGWVARDFLMPKAA